MFRKIIVGLVAATALAAPGLAEKGDVLIRARAIMVAPNEKSGDISGLPGQQVSVNNSVMPEVDFSYFLTKNVAAELIVATTKHSVSGTSGLTGGIGKLASTWVLPPTLTVQYHPLPDGKFRPYIGAGINYTIFYSTKPSAGFVNVAGDTHVGMKDSVGYALQAGVDVPIGERAFVNLDIKYIDIDTTATLVTANLGTRQVRVNLDPIVVGVGIGWRF